MLQQASFPFKLEHPLPRLSVRPRVTEPRYGMSAWGLGNATVDFYIGQADILLRVLRIHGTAKLGGKLIQETIEDRYSGYGEPVTVKLPAACRATTAAIRGAVRYYAGFSVPHGGQQTIAVVKHQAEPDLPVLRLLPAPGGTGDDRRQS